MRIVAEGGAKRRGVPVDEAQLGALEQRIVANFDRQSDAFYTSGRLLDDGVIDPRDTRRVLGLAFELCRSAQRRTLRPVQFGVARP
jgi:geranyl-CoA carboxylase beta subunit